MYILYELLVIRIMLICICAIGNKAAMQACNHFDHKGISNTISYMHTSSPHPPVIIYSLSIMTTRFCINTRRHHIVIHLHLEIPFDQCKMYLYLCICARVYYCLAPRLELGAGARAKSVVT